MLIAQIIFQLAEWIGVSSPFVEEAARLDMVAFAYPAVRSRHEVPMGPAVNACVTVGAKINNGFKGIKLFRGVGCWRER